MAREGRPQIDKARLRRAYLALVERGVLEHDEALLARLTTKPTRTHSGVAPVTVLTKPYPCPGQCIFCPTDIRMPKSYLSDEPGAMRALRLDFDPAVQTAERIRALEHIGHATDKVELLILGGTWSCYPPDYREWFIQRCFDALNGVETAAIEKAHRVNETAPHRCVGLVIETRPDYVTPQEVRDLRRLGVTRVQLGVQSLDDRILALNKRGHTVENVRRAMTLLRGAGFKVAFHWMPNLLGATPESDREDFRRLWDDPALRPDELKIYPTGLLRGTDLYDHYLRREYRPYTEEELTDLLAAVKPIIPPYCRLNRLMRDIPAPDIAAGVTTSNLRQIVQGRLNRAGTPCRCIRCREVRREPVDAARVTIHSLRYATAHSEEVFLSAVTPQDRLAGFLRLSLPARPAPLAEIDGHALIRQVQVYGPVVALDEQPGMRAQHQGLGSRLIAAAREAAREAGFRRWSVIAAAGTRDYYRRHGFELGDLYMSTAL
ncbi:MAG: tRNA uridine(34) 5-carboxymethylaminomethyl modification radical SAM/GNAT enzyme Elp3 [Anaerolineae bacterium]